MVELLVPAETHQLEHLQGSARAYDLWFRPRLTIEAIEQLQDAGVEPDVWNIEGLAKHEDCEEIVATARRDGRTGLLCIVVGRGEEEDTAKKWLTLAARVPGFIGFAVGGTELWEPLFAWREKEVARQEAVAWITAQYRHFVDTFEGPRRTAQPDGELS